MGFARTLARGVGSRAIIIEDETGSWAAEGDGAERLNWLLGAGTLAGQHITPEKSLRMIAMHAAVALRVAAVRQMPLQVYEERADGFKDYAAGRKNRYFPLVHELPNPEQPADEMWAQLAGHLAYRSNAFLWKERHNGGTRDGLVRALWPIDPRRVIVRRVGGVKVFDVSNEPEAHDSEAHRYGPDEIIHVKTGLLSRNGLVGLSPIAQCREELATHAGVREYLARHIGRGANFTGYLHTTDKIKDDIERERIEESIVAPARGARGVTRVPLFEGDIKWEQIGMSLADQQFLELLGFGVADIALLMDTPPTLLNAPVRQGTLVYRNQREETQRFLTYAVGPGLGAMQTALRTDPDLFRGSGFVPGFDREGALAMDTLARYQAHALAIRAGWKTPNDVRRAENLEPVEGGDALMRPGAQPDPQTRALLNALETATRKLDAQLEREPALT